MKQNLVIDQGTDFSIDLIVKEGTGRKDLTGYSAASQMKTYYDSYGDTSFVATVLEPATNGVIRLELGNEVTDGLVASKYLYDVEVTDPSSKKTRVAEGIVTVTPSITKV